MGFLAENAGMISQGAGMLSTVAGAITGSKGAKAVGAAESNADLFNADVAATNAKIALQNATFAGQAGEVAVGISGERTREAVGGLLAGQAASGVDVTSESAANVRASESAKGMFDALTIRSNAAKAAYGFQTQAADSTASAANLRNKATLARQAGDVKSSSTLLSGLSKAGASFSDYMLQNSLSPGGEKTSQALAPKGGSTYSSNLGWIDWNK